MNLKLDTDLPTTHGCQSGAIGFVVGAEVRWVEGMHELEFPPVPFPSRRIFELAGAGTLRALVLRHHQRLYETPLRALFHINKERFLAGVARAADYAIETCGGPRDFTSRHGKPCMRRRHYPFTIDEGAREVWLRELWLAFDDVSFPAQLRREYWEWVEAFSIRMINRRTQRAQPQRFPFTDMPSSLLQVEVAPDRAGHVAMV
jgi:hemoglobin